MEVKVTPIVPKEVEYEIKINLTESEYEKLRYEFNLVQGREKSYFPNSDIPFHCNLLLKLITRTR